MVDKITLLELNNQGFSISERTKMAVSGDAIAKDLLRFLVDYPLMNFIFAKFKDEIADVSKNGVNYECFGRSPYGPLLIQEDGTVILSQSKFDNIFQGNLIYINQNFTNFVKSYAWFLAAAANQRAELGKLGKETEKIAAAFKKKVASVDSKSFEPNTFWSRIYYMLDDMGVTVATSMDAYMDSGRFSVGSKSDIPPLPSEMARLTDRQV